MVTIHRESSDPYIVTYGCIPLDQVANVEFKMPRSMINEEGNHMTKEFLTYALPLIEGEPKSVFRGGVAQLARIKTNEN